MLGYANLRGEALDLPFNIYSFADGGKPMVTVMNISLDKIEAINGGNGFRDFKVSLGLDADDQLKPAVTLWSTMPFFCSWPNDVTGCRKFKEARGFFQVTIDQLDLGKMFRALFDMQPGQKYITWPVLTNINLIIASTHSRLL